MTYCDILTRPWFLPYYDCLTLPYHLTLIAWLNLAFGLCCDWLTILTYCDSLNLQWLTVITLLWLLLLSYIKSSLTGIFYFSLLSTFLNLIALLFWENNWSLKTLKKTNSLHSTSTEIFLYLAGIYLFVWNI